MKNAVLLVVGLALLVVGVPVVAVAVGPVFTAFVFAGLWHWSVLGGLVAAVGGALALDASGVLSR